MPASAAAGVTASAASKAAARRARPWQRRVAPQAREGPAGERCSGWRARSKGQQPATATEAHERAASARKAEAGGQDGLGSARHVVHSRACTARLCTDSVVPGPRSRQAVPARHGTTKLSCLLGLGSDRTVSIRVRVELGRAAHLTIYSRVKREPYGFRLDGNGWLIQRHLQPRLLCPAS